MAETLEQQNKRLKNRKPVYTETYKKGLFMIEKEALCKWIMQDEVVIRIHKAGELDDGTEFNNISVEGFKP